MIHVLETAPGEYELDWQEVFQRRPVTVVVDSDPRVANGVQIGAQQIASGRYSGLTPDRRYYFKLNDETGVSAVAAERGLPAVEGSVNFRDFGGYRTRHGDQVRWGSLYRSGQLSDLTDQDVALMHDLGIDFICDFRREDEQQSAPTRLSDNSSTRILSLPIVPGSNAAYFEEMSDWDDPAHMFDFMVTVNRDLAVAQTDAYRKMFDQLLSVEDARMLVHCSAGKDRTGFAAAIILLALGVPREVVMQDYLLSARYFRPLREIERLKVKYGLEELPEEAIMPMLQVHEDYLAEALNTIDANYDSVEHYLEDELGVGPRELAELRRRYLLGNT